MIRDGFIHHGTDTAMEDSALTGAPPCFSPHWKHLFRTMGFLLTLLLLLAGCDSDATSRFTFQGRKIVVKGGRDQSIDCQQNRCQIRIDGHTAILTPQSLIVDGKTEVLPQSGNLTLSLTGKGISVSYDLKSQDTSIPGNPDTGILPEGFVRIHHGGEGEALYLRVQGGSATRQLVFAASRLDSYFDIPIRFLQGFRDRDDTQAQAVFSTRLQGQPVVGVIESRIQRHQGRVGLVFDRGDRIAATVRPLLATLAPVMGTGQGNRAPKQDLNWRQVPLPDGSGSIRIPQNWRILSSHQGAVDLAGPQGERISLGMAIPIATPEAAMNPLTGQPMAGTFSAYPADPLTTLRQVVPSLSRYMAGRTGGVYIQKLKIIEAAPTVSPTQGQAAFVLWDAWMSDGRFRAFSLIDVSPISAGWWQLYYTTLAAPPRQFAASLATMMRIWQSGWRIDPRVFQRRLQQAYRDMQETSRLISEAAQYRERVFEDARADWTEVFRGERMVLDTRMGEYHFTDIGWVDETVQRLNEQAGYERFVQIPLREFNR